MGSDAQVKEGGLWLNTLGAAVGLIVDKGNVGIGTNSPAQKLDVGGGIEVGNTTNATAGTIRWTGSDLEVYNGSAWVSLTSGETTVIIGDSVECDAANGSWEGGQQICYFSGSSCPSPGWTPKESYSSTQSNYCNIAPLYCNLVQACSTGSHFRSNAGTENCTYIIRCSGNQRGPLNRTCSASQTEIGCVKN